MTQPLTVAGELARMAALFQTRAIVTHMGAPSLPRMTDDGVIARVSAPPRKDDV